MNESLLQRASYAHRAGNLPEAARLYTEILRADPRHFPALFALGTLYYQAGRWDEAERILAEAARIQPRAAEVFFFRGCALQRLTRAAEALACFDSALTLKPNFVEAHSNRCVVLMALNRHAQALESANIALALDPNALGASINRGCILENLGRHAEAIDCFDRVLAKDPASVEALINRGSALSGLKQFQAAAADFERALGLDPARAYARGNLVLFRMHACDWRQRMEDERAIAAALRQGERAVYPFVDVALTSSAEDHLQCARLWTVHEAPPSPAHLWRGERYRHGKIRVAYVSADFHAHATVALMAGLFEQHDRARFEICGISFGRDDKSPMRARTITAFDRFLEARDKSDGEIAAMIRQMEIDIAVDLKGYTQAHRSGIFAHRPAPVQASYIGYPGTMGAPYIDYIIADRITIPPQHFGFYTEKIAFLPGTYQCNDRQRRIAAETPSRAEAGLPEGAFVFCCFNNSYKIAPATFDIWMEILRDVPTSVLWLLDDNRDASRNLRREAEARGVAPERLIFAPRAGLEDHLARHRLADLFLDTLPYGAHTTASDALWAGLPVLTRLGESFAGRVAASLLHAVGLPELVTANGEEYRSLARELARDRGKLDAMKERLQASRDTHALFDTEASTRNLEALYAAMWQRSQKGQAPDHIALT